MLHHIADCDPVAVAWLGLKLRLLCCCHGRLQLRSLNINRLPFLLQGPACRLMGFAVIPQSFRSSLQCRAVMLRKSGTGILLSQRSLAVTVMLCRRSFVPCLAGMHSHSFRHSLLMLWTRRLVAVFPGFTAAQLMRLMSWVLHTYIEAGTQADSAGKVQNLAILCQHRIEGCRAERRHGDTPQDVIPDGGTDHH